MIAAFVKTTLIQYRFVFKEGELLNYLKTIQQQDDGVIDDDQAVKIFPPLMNPLINAVLGNDGVFDSILEPGVNHVNFTIGFGLSEIQLSMYGSESNIQKICFNILFLRELFFEVEESDNIMEIGRF